MAVMTRRGVLVILATAGAMATLPAHAAPPQLKQQADAFLEDAYPADGPGAAVIITENGRVVYARGRGLANVEARTPITPNTVFRLGSITKQFAAAIILQLAQEGRLSLDDPITRFFPDYPQPGGGATVRQLLNHTVGIQSYTGMPGAMTEESTSRARTTEEMIAWFRDQPAPSKPGEAWAYNNSGYVLVGAIIEKVTGKPWHQVVSERITTPLKLASIRYGVEEPRIPNMARGYTRNDQGVRPAQAIHMSVPHAAGALTGNVRDLATWAQALHHGKVVNQAHYTQMIKPTDLPGGKTHPYGYGIAPGTIRGQNAIGHGGGIFGFTTDSTYVPSKGIFVAVFANSDEPATSPSLALRRLTAMAVGDPYPAFKTARVDAAALAPLFGLYRSPDGTAERRFYARDGKLYTLRSGAQELEVTPAGGDRFFYDNSLSWFELRRAGDGAHVMAFRGEGEEPAVEWKRAGPIPPEAAAAEVPRATLERYVGSYNMGPVTLTVTLGADGRLSAQLTGQPALPLTAISATEFRPSGVDARVVFKEEAGAVTGVVIHQNGRELPGKRMP